MALVAIAGPLANLIMAIIWAIVLKFGYNNHYLGQMAYYGIIINLVLMVLNMLPIPPLDGSRVVTSFLPNNLAYKYNQYEKYGLYILLALVIIPINGTSILSYIIKPFINISMQIINALIF